MRHAYHLRGSRIPLLVASFVAVVLHIVWHSADRRASCSLLTLAHAGYGDVVGDCLLTRVAKPLAMVPSGRKQA